MRTHRLGSLALLIALSAIPVLSAGRQEQVQFPAGKSTVSLKGSIIGSDDVSYMLAGQGEQDVTITLRAGGATYFNIFEPGKQAGKDMAMFIGQNEGRTFRGKFGASGDYTIMVYQMRSAARRGTSAPFTITFQLGKAATAGKAK